MLFKNLFENLQSIFGLGKARQVEEATSSKVSNRKVNSVSKSGSGSATSSGFLPDISHPAWQHLVDRQINLETNNFGLQMLLSWAWKKSSTENNQDDVLSKCKNVRTYFEKNRRVLQNELDQIFGKGNY